jgi:hypothetical protein
MYIEINSFGFHDAFHRAGRGKQFSYEALDALYLYLDELEDSMGEQIEVDVIALCCEYDEVGLGDVDYERYCDGGDLEEQVVAYLKNSILVRAS